MMELVSNDRTKDLHSCGEKNKQWQTKKNIWPRHKDKNQFYACLQAFKLHVFTTKKPIVQPGANNYIKLHNFCQQTFTQTTEELWAMWRSFQDRYKTPRS